MKSISKIKSNAVGYDSVSIKFLKLVKIYFVEALAHMFNHSINEKAYADIWKILIVRPIPKVVNPKVMKKVRPVGSVVPKLLTNIVNERMSGFLEREKMIVPQQSGFRTNHSCTTALLKDSEDIWENISLGKVTILVLLDIKSAYPSVSHDLMLHILKKNGFTDDVVGWFDSFSQE